MYKLVSGGAHQPAITSRYSHLLKSLYKPPTPPLMKHPTKMQNLFITILIIFFLYNPSAALGEGTLAGGWKPIPDVTDPTVVDIAKFAVDEHNKEAHAALKFVKVVKGESQVVSGKNYNLTIMAADGGAGKNYVALVWDKPWQKFRKLVSFKGPV
ncbi:putative Cystatin domain-containing protein [Helianthus anomalus]